MTTKRMHGDTMGIEKEIEPIRPGGDLLLEVGGRWGFEPTLLLVSADWLCAVSPVFKVMLTGSFQEASTPRSPETPQKIQLPSDSWTGIRDMCALVHHNLKNIGTSRSWSASRVFALAQTIDKYLCKEALHLQMQAIFAQYFEELEQRTELAENLGQVATAAYLLQDGRAFEKATLHLLMDCRGRYDRLHLYATSGILPWSVLFALEEKRTHIYNELVQRVTQARTPNNWLLAGPRCEVCYPQQLGNLFEVHNWPPDLKEHTVGDLVSTIQDAFKSVPLECDHQLEPSVPRSDLVRIAMEITENYCHGLCLWCIKPKESLHAPMVRCTIHDNGRRAVPARGIMLS